MNRSCKLGFGKKFSSLMVRISCLLIAVVMTLLASGGSVWAVNVEGHDGGGSGGNSSNGSSSELPTCAPSCTLNIKFGTYGENGTFNSLLETSQTFSVEDISDFDEDAELDSYELYDNPDGTAYKITMNVEGSEVIIFGSQDDLNDYMAGRDSKAIGIDLTGLIDPDNLQNQFVVFGLVGGNGVAADLVVYDAEGNRVIKQTADIPLTGPENGAGYFAFLMNEDGEIIAAETQDTPDNEQTVTDDPVESSGDECFDGSGSLGWLLCPVIEAMSDVGKFLYGQIEENFLQIQAEDFFETGGGLAVAWGYIRNIANIFFIILFLVVIFSQLTGVGIDNYGIKKILPKLIVVAVLVNLSFLICEIAVDLSNIFGAGLKSMFAGLAVEVQDSVGIRMERATMSGSLAAAGLGAGGAVLFALVSNPVGWGGAVLAGIGIGLAVLGIAITLLISLLFLFLILMIRNAGVVLLIAIAPVAIVCYALPNTEKLFKRWFSLFKSLLVIYPICGLLVGGGQLAGMILGSINNSAMKLAGMVVEVVPFFLIPMLLRRSLSMMGNVGARLSNVGRGVGRRLSEGAQRGMTNSNRYKDALNFRQEQRAFRQAERTRNRLSGRTNLSTRQADRLRKAEDAVLAQRKKREENAAREGGAYFAAMSNKQDLERENEQAVVENYGDANYLSAMRNKQELERASEARTVAQYNDPSYRDARKESLSEEARKQRSKDQTLLAMSKYKNEGLPQLQGRWENAFKNGDTEELDALTNVMTQRYGTSAASSIGSSLSRMNGINSNTNYQKSMRALQQTMNDNSAFAGNMKNKASDAFQMISDGGMVYDSSTGQTSYKDLDHFTNENTVSKDIKDWSTQSTATLQRAIDSGKLSDDMIEKMLESDDPSVKSGLQSDEDKRQALQAALYNRAHNPSGVGPNLPNDVAAANYEAERQRKQNENEIYISHEEEAMRRGKGTINIITNGSSFEGYAVPPGFNTGGAAPVRDAHGDYIYTDIATGRKWNASTAKYVRK